jgi:hypothetical protein
MDEIHIDVHSPPLEAHVNALRSHAQLVSETMLKDPSTASLMIHDFLEGLNPYALAVLIEETNARANLQKESNENENNVSFAKEDSTHVEVQVDESADEPNFITDNETAAAVPIRTISVTFAVQQQDQHQPFNQNSTTVNTSLLDYLLAPMHEFNSKFESSQRTRHQYSHRLLHRPDAHLITSTRIDHINKKPAPADSGGATHSPPLPAVCIHLQL